MASCDPPLIDLRVAGQEDALPKCQVGEIWLRGPSLMSGYVGAAGCDPFADGWLCTDDLGYLAGGELYVTGRAKDMVILMGHNDYSEDFEWAAARLDGVRPGRCVAFALPGAEKVVLPGEARNGVSPRRLERRVSNSIFDAVGVRPSEVRALAPGTVQKTTGGKLRQPTMRDRYRNGVSDASTERVPPR
jgi:acyl-CoA synthetase (AMP-forming)/AMP-acid ligase II